MKRIAWDDLVGIVGLLMMVAGIWLWSRPAAIVLAGFFLFAFASGLHTVGWRLLAGLVARHGVHLGKRNDGNIRRAS